MFDEPISWPQGYRACVMFTFDLDAESGVLHTHPESRNHLDVLAHQQYGVRSGLARLLRLLKAHELPGTFFVPGYCAKQWPAAVTAILEAGHEVGCHGYLHESVHDVSEAVEREYLARTLEAFETLTTTRPVGYRAPKFHLNFRTPALLTSYGFTYDSSLQDSDWPYLIDCSDHGACSARIAELPVQYALDDGTYYLHLPGLRDLPTLTAPSAVHDIWDRELDAIVEEGGLYVMTLHPLLSGRPSRAQVLDSLMSKVADDSRIWVASGSEVAEWVGSHAHTVRHHRAAYLPWEGKGAADERL